MINIDKKDAAASKDSSQYICFSIKAKVYCLPVEIVKSIVMFRDYTVVPKAPFYIKGILNLRGDIVPIFDVLGKMSDTNFALDNRDYCLIVVEFDGVIVGLMVDYAMEVIDVFNKDIIPYYHDILYKENNYIKEVIISGESKKFILDYENLLK